jgi:hypothetical protein
MSAANGTIQGINESAPAVREHPGADTERLVSMQQEPTTDIPYGFCQCGCGRETNRWKWSDRSVGRVKGEPARYINGHQPPYPRPSAEARFWAKVNKDGPLPAHRPELGECWLWTAARNRQGYGRLRVGGSFISAHRFAYELLVGPIPGGLTIDHLCVNPPCVNPAHFEPVTAGENALRGEGPPARNARRTHCKRGHLLAGENLYLHAGRRHCRACRNEWRLENRVLATFIGEVAE